MAHDVLRTLLKWMEELRPALTRPGHRNAVVVFAGWVLTQGSHAVTQALVMTDVSRRRHHETYHRFFSRGAWSPDEIGHLLFKCILRLAPGTAIHAAVDDTLAAKKGPSVFGLGCHLDAVRSTRRVRVFCFGHVWVVVAIIVRLPFSSRPWALPVLFRLYRNKKECLGKGHPYRKKTELARELVDLLATWSGERRIFLAADSAYCNDTLMRELATTVVVFGAMRPDAVLTALPTDRERRKTGRRRTRGRVLPKPGALAKSQRHPWKRCQAELYGRRRTVFYKMLDAQWYRACGGGLVRIVVVKSLQGAIPFRVFLCTDVALTVTTILETYAGRWAIEVCFRDLKQLLGFADSSARTRAAVERTAPFVGYIYTLLVLWFTDSVWTTSAAALPVRPWYPHKKGLCFADVLRTARSVLGHLDVLDPARSIEDLRKRPPPRRVRFPARRARGSAAGPTRLRRTG
jgi:hypothetical protein